MEVPFALPECCQDELSEIAGVIECGWLTTASRCARLEKEFSELMGSKHALAVNSATAALHLGLEALGIKPGDRVLVPTFTFTASAEVIRYLGADPVFVDCDRDTFCITVAEIERSLEDGKIKSLEKRAESGVHGLKAIIPVHFGGHACEMDGIMQFAEEYGLKIMEDAAHALPTRYARREHRAEGIEQGAKKQEYWKVRGIEGEKEIHRLRRLSQIKQKDKNPGEKRLIGTIGDVTCFSFYANKTMTTGEGGILCTADDEIAKRVKVMRLHGINRDVWDRFNTGASWEYDVVAPGFKYNMPDILAAIGIHQLKKVEIFRDKRQRIAEAYFDGLKDVPGLILPKIKCDMEDHSWYLYVVLIEQDETVNGIDRNRFIEEMTKRNIGTSVHYKPLHRMTYYKEQYNLKPEMFPNAEWVFNRCVSLPIYSAMKDEQVEYVIESIREILSTDYTD